MAHIIKTKKKEQLGKCTYYSKVQEKRFLGQKRANVCIPMYAYLYDVLRQFEHDCGLQRIRNISSVFVSAYRIAVN